jgi:hypothetical protein
MLPCSSPDTFSTESGQNVGFVPTVLFPLDVTSLVDLRLQTTSICCIALQTILNGMPQEEDHDKQLRD